MARRICIVEDEPLNLRLAVTLLEKLGHSVVSAASGREAVALLQTEAVDLVLLDLGLPDMRGHRVARQLRKMEATRHLPIYAFTSEEEDKVALSEAGFDGYLEKPFRDGALQRVLDGVGTATAPVSAVLPCLDLAGLRERVCGDDELVKELLKDFIEIAGDLVADVVKALATGDRRVLKAAAHRLKGSLLAIGAQRAANATKLVEDGSLESDFAALRALLERAAADVADARAAAEIAA